MIAPRQPETCNHPAYTQMFTGIQDVFSLLVVEQCIGHIEIQRCAKPSNTMPVLCWDVQLKFDLAETYTQFSNL